MLGRCARMGSSWIKLVFEANTHNQPSVSKVLFCAHLGFDKVRMSCRPKRGILAVLAILSKFIGCRRVKLLSYLACCLGDSLKFGFMKLRKGI